MRSSLAGQVRSCRCCTSGSPANTKVICIHDLLRRSMHVKIISRLCAAFLPALWFSAGFGQGSASPLPNSLFLQRQSVESNLAGERDNKSHLPGIVIDHTGSLVENYSYVEIRIVPARSSAPVNQTAAPWLRLQTDHEGQFSADLPPGKYEICVRWFPKSCQTVTVDEIPTYLEYLTLKISPGDERPPAGLFENRLAELAGAGATNCGHVRSSEHPRQATRCALRAFKSHLAFHVSYEPGGIGDSYVVEGFAGDGKGNLSYIDYDSMGFNLVGLGPGVTAPDGFHTVVRACAHPVRLRKTREGKLKCFANGRWIGTE